LICRVDPGLITKIERRIGGDRGIGEGEEINISYI
jgi:hypothetical protein